MLRQGAHQPGTPRLKARERVHGVPGTPQAPQTLGRWAPARRAAVAPLLPHALAPQAAPPTPPLPLPPPKPRSLPAWCLRDAASQPPWAHLV